MRDMTGARGVRDRPTWTPLILADSIGMVTAAAGTGSTIGLHLASRRASSSANGASDLQRIGDFPGVPVRRFLGVDAGPCGLLLSDGRVALVAEHG